jgi:hypothetical protein
MERIMINHEILGAIFSEKLSRWAAGIWKVFECGVVGCPHQASPSLGQTSDIEAKLKKNTEGGATKILIGDFEAINTMTYV